MLYMAFLLGVTGQLKPVSGQVAACLYILVFKIFETECAFDRVVVSINTWRKVASRLYSQSQQLVVLGDCGLDILKCGTSSPGPPYFAFTPSYRNSQFIENRRQRKQLSAALNTWQCVATRHLIQQSRNV